MRKSPYRHGVHSHIRDGHQVTNYIRGEGRRDPTRARKVVGGRPTVGGFTVKLDGQRFKSNARSFTGAIQDAFSEYSGDAPKRMTIMRGG